MNYHRIAFTGRGKDLYLNISEVEKAGSGYNPVNQVAVFHEDSGYGKILVILTCEELDCLMDNRVVIIPFNQQIENGVLNVSL